MKHVGILISRILFLEGKPIVSELNKIHKHDPSPTLPIFGKTKDTLMGRSMGSLIEDGSDCAVIDKIKNAAIDFVRGAFGHLKAIAVDKSGQALLKTANVGQDAGVMDANNTEAFIAAAKTR